MKRDMDLCRKILLSVEAREGTVDPVWVELEGYTDGQIGYHAKLLADGGLLEGVDCTALGKATAQTAINLGASAGRGTTSWKLPGTTHAGEKLWQ